MPVIVHPPESTPTKIRGAPQTARLSGNLSPSSTGNLTGRLTEVALGYQRVLERNPRQPHALVGMSLVALASRQSESAVKMASAAAAELGKAAQSDKLFPNELVQEA